MIFWFKNVIVFCKTRWIRKINRVSWSPHIDMDKDQEARKLKISTWLGEIGKSRDWLAEQLGVSITTVNGWFSPASERPIPIPTNRLIDKLMQDIPMGEPRFTIPECDRIKKAMQSAGYVSFCEFARDAVKSRAETILNRPLTKVAEIPENYPNPSGQ